MRWLVLLFVLPVFGGCDLWWSQDPNTTDDDGTECKGPPPTGNCTCLGAAWSCSTCTFFEGRAPLACSEPGRSCQLETWEHGCDCTCGADGWWHCLEETIGSRCPMGGPDAGIDVPPDAPPDAP